VTSVVRKSPPRLALPPSSRRGYNPGMSEHRKKSPWPWIAATVIGLPVLYALSFGPSFWLVNLELIPERPVALVYRPLAVCLARCAPGTIGEAFFRYGSAFAPPDKVPACSRLFVRVAFDIPESVQ
jgi:hypothetical protein